MTKEEKEIFDKVFPRRKELTTKEWEDLPSAIAIELATMIMESEDNLRYNSETGSYQEDKVYEKWTEQEAFSQHMRDLQKPDPNTVR